MRQDLHGAQRASLDPATGSNVSGAGFAAAPGRAIRPHSGAAALAATGSLLRHLLPSLRGSATLVVVAFVAAALVVAPQTASAGGGGKGKAVIIVGPAGGSTSNYKAKGEAWADAAARQGMDVRRIFHPNATWGRVLDNIQNAKLVVYLGHGNGWPSPYGNFQTDTKNGFGLNPYGGASAYATKYYGEGPIAKNVELGKNAIVVLQNLCYAAGNGEPGMGIPSRSLAKERVDNFAAGFQRAGAAVVFAYGWRQELDFPKALFNTSKTMDEIFKIRGQAEYVTGFIGANDSYLDSVRTNGARIHLDPSPRYGYLRAVTGKLDLTTGEWRGAAPEPPAPPEVDEQAPELALDAPLLAQEGEDQTPGPAALAEADLPLFSPNADGYGDELRVAHTISEAAFIDVKVRDAAGDVVRKFTVWSEKGEGSSSWDGQTDANDRVNDGFYTLTFEPRDRAGNVGAAVMTGARVVTAFRGLSRSTRTILARDEDSLARAVTFGVEVKRPATVTWTIINHEGNVVRSLMQDEAVEPGQLDRTWDGRNDSGNFAKDGSYYARISAGTDVGVQTHRIPFYVGAFKVRTTDATPRRGQRVTYTVHATEPIQGRPRVLVAQPGLKLYSVATSRSSATRFKVYLNIRSGGRAGTLKITISGTDTRGGSQSQTFSYTLD